MNLLWIFQGRFVAKRKLLKAKSKRILAWICYTKIQTTKLLKTEFCGFCFALCKLLARFLAKAQNGKVRRHYKMTKCVFFASHCEPFSQKNGVTIHKFKQTLSQKFKQSLKNPKNSANRPQAHHKNFQWIAKNLHAHALQILAMTKSVLSYWAFGEVSTKSKCALNSMDFSPTVQYGIIEFLLRLATRWVALC